MTAQPVEISVVVPCWNVEPYLARCLESVFAALPANAEVRLPFSNRLPRRNRVSRS